MSRSSNSYFLFLVSVLLTTRGLPQPFEAGRISGTVTDSSGAAISGAKIALAAEGHLSPLAIRSSDASGRYTFELVEAGKYRVTAELPGFQKASQRPVELTSGHKAVVDFTLVPIPSSDAGVGASNAKPGFGDPGYYDAPQLKAGELTGSIDPGGYSAPGQAERTTHLLEGAVGLKNESAAGPAERASALPPVGNDELAEIEPKLKRAAETNPQSFESNHLLGEFYIHVGKLALALPYLEKAYRLNPSHYVNAYDLALAYLETRDYDAARELIHAMIQRQDAAELHDLMAEVEEKSGHFLEAANEYERAALMEPSEKHIFDWGVELLQHHTLEPAAKIFRSGVERYPLSAKLLIGLGIALYSRGQYDEAVKALARATDLEPSDPRPYLFLGRMYNISRADVEGITERLRRFAQLQPQNAQALYYYALSLWKGRRDQDRGLDPAQIETLLKNAASLDPRFPDVHLQLGTLYAEQKDYAQAVREYQQAISLQPNLADAHYRLGQAYTHTGEKVRARNEFELYERLHNQQLTETERQRAEIQQFVYTIQEGTKP